MQDHLFWLARGSRTALKCPSSDCLHGEHLIYLRLPLAHAAQHDGLGCLRSLFPLRGTCSRHVDALQLDGVAVTVILEKSQEILGVVEQYVFKV